MDYPQISIFGSFLDRDSYQLARAFIQALEASDAFYGVLLNVIFFPVSHHFYANMALMRQATEWLMDFKFSREFENEEGLDRLLEAGIVFHSKAKMELQACFDPCRPFGQNAISSKIEDNRDAFLRHEMHKALYGSLAASYLKHFSTFPTVILGEQRYNGVPLQFTPQLFVEKILINDLNEMLHSSPTIINSTEVSDWKSKSI